MKNAKIKDIAVNETMEKDLTQSKFYDRYFSTHVSGYAPYEAKYAFAQHYIIDYERQNKNSGAANLSITVKRETHIDDVVEWILANSMATHYNYHSSGFIVLRDDETKFLCMISMDLDDMENEYKEIYIDIYADREIARSLKNDIKHAFNDEISARINWQYISGGATLSKNIYLTDVHSVYDEYYPFLEQGYEQYIKNYMESKSNILILYGPPGTGKTSFIRRFLFDYKMKAMVFYDENMTNTDGVLVNFLTREDNDILVLEDADTLLGKRSEGNKVMSKLLNASDGLVNIMNKKIIITTNLSNVKDIDEAMLRPGRCFGAVEFRALTSDEAMVACKKAGTDFSNLPEKKNYTLAEVFTGQAQEYTKKVKVGFV